MPRTLTDWLVLLLLAAAVTLWHCPKARAYVGRAWWWMNK